MPLRALDFPARIVLIAVAIAALLGGLVWFVSGLGSPAQPPPPAPEEPELQPEALEPLHDEDLPAIEPLVEDDGVVRQTVTVQLYLADPGSRRLVPRVRRLRAPATLAAQAQMALEALARVGDGELSSPLPPGTVIREVWVSASGIAYVDLPRDFSRLLAQGSTAEIHAVYGIVGTLTSSFPQIRAVQILLDGRPVESLTGHLDLSLPMLPLSEWLQ